MWGYGLGRAASGSCLETKSKPRTCTHTLVRPKQRKRDMRFGAWNVGSSL